MTIAAGFTSPTGIVVCSDSLESTAVGYGKGMVQKVFVEPVEPGFLYFSAAGYPGPCDFVRQQIVAALRAEPQWNKDRYVEVIRQVVRDYYKDHVWPSGLASQFGAVIALWGHNNEHVLLKTDLDSTVVQCRAYACVGIGSKAAERAAALFFPGNPGACLTASFDQLVAIAAYVIWVAKETIDGCGGPTQIAVYSKAGGGFIHHTSVAIDALEGAFSEFEHATSHAMRRLLHPGINDEEVFRDFQQQVMTGRAFSSWRRWQAEWERMTKDDTSRAGPRSPQDSTRDPKSEPPSPGSRGDSDES